MKIKSDALGYYAILEVYPQDDISVIKERYYEKAKYWHPDHNQDERSLEIFRRISIAYDVMKDEKSRLYYDLLSLVYDEGDFPKIGSLKVYKNQAGKEDKALRVLKQRRVNKGVVRESKDICNVSEANGLALSTSMNNWFKGWWGKRGFSNTMQAIRFNLREADGNDEDNLKLLIHNALAYAQENNAEMAWVYAKQAEMLLKNEPEAKKLLEKFVAGLNFMPRKSVKIPRWNGAEIRRRQFLAPLVLGLVIILCVVMLAAKTSFYASQIGANDKYFEERMVGGAIMPSDMVENKILKVDSDPRSSEYLVHFNKDCNVYYGPSTKYDVMGEIDEGHTVRITGYTYDKKWYQVIVDNGERVYVRKEDIAKGMGNPVPFGSQVYKGN